MEVKESSIDIQMVCPGPVVSKISMNAFSSQLDKVCTIISVYVIFTCTCTQPVGDLEQNQSGRMSTERCVHLMLVGMANRLKELWISPNPILLFTYLMQYFPNLALK